MTRPLRTWTVSVADDAAAIWTPAQRVALAAVHISALDEPDAEVVLIEALGLELVPCCGDDPDEPPCANCDAQLAGEAIDRAMDMEQDRRAGLGGPTE